MTYRELDLDADGSAYKAAIVYIEGAKRIEFNGSHGSFDAARDRARRLCQALRDAGEMGIKPLVYYCGERPADFPRNGVTV